MNLQDRACCSPCTPQGPLPPPVWDTVHGMHNNRGCSVSLNALTNALTSNRCHCPSLVPHVHPSQAIVYDTMNLMKHASGIHSRFSFNDTRAVLRTHLGEFISELHYVTTAGRPTMPEHVALMQHNPVQFKQLQNGVVHVVSVTYAVHVCPRLCMEPAVSNV